MFTFWITVILYSMAILILVYLHQFEQFPRYWAAIGISKELYVLFFGFRCIQIL